MEALNKMTGSVEMQNITSVATKLEQHQMAKMVYSCYEKLFDLRSVIGQKPLERAFTESMCLVKENGTQSSDMKHNP